MEAYRHANLSIGTLAELLRMGVIEADRRPAEGRVPLTCALDDLQAGRQTRSDLLRDQDARRAARWISEAGLLAAGASGKLPDALLKLRSGKIAVEFGGAYTARKLAEFHEYCERQRLAYEVW